SHESRPDVYAPERGLHRLRADGRDPPAPVHLHALFPGPPQADPGPDGARHRPGLRAGRALHLLEPDGTPVRGAALPRGTRRLRSRRGRGQPALGPTGGIGRAGAAAGPTVPGVLLVPGLGTITAASRAASAARQAAGVFDEVQKTMWHAEAQRH